MFCQKCGNQLNEGAKFCNKCGSQQQITAADKQSLPSQSSNASAIHNPSLPTQHTTLTIPATQVKTGGNKTWVWAAGGLALFLIAGGIILSLIAFFWFYEGFGYGPYEDHQLVGVWEMTDQSYQALIDRSIEMANNAAGNQGLSAGIFRGLDDLVSGKGILESLAGALIDGADSAEDAYNEALENAIDVYFGNYFPIAMEFDEYGNYTGNYDGIIRKFDWEPAADDSVIVGGLLIPYSINGSRLTIVIDGVRVNYE